MSWRDYITEIGGDIELYEGVLEHVTEEWSRTDLRGEQCAWLETLHELGVVEKRRVDNFRDNGSFAGSYAEYRRPERER